jgi:hypothetical protein
VAVYLGRFSCFTLLALVDPYTRDITAGIFAVTAIAFLFVLVVYGVKATRYSSGMRVATVGVQTVFGLLAALFGISVFAVLMIADRNGTDGELRAAHRIFMPEGDVTWVATNPSVCELQKDFGCMMWDDDSTCALPNVTANATATTTTSLAAEAASNVSAACVICGLNVSSINSTHRPPTCFKAVLKCFTEGRYRGETSHSHEAPLLISGALLILIGSVLSIYGNVARSMKEWTGYGAVEAGGFSRGGGGGVEADYAQLSTGAAYGSYYNSRQ